MTMKRVLIHRHPNCERCARIARIHHVTDWFNRIDTTTAIPPSGPLVPGRIVVIDLVRGVRVCGAEAVAFIWRQVPLYWPMLALLWIPAVRRRIAREIDPDVAEHCATAAGAAHPTS